VKSKHEKSNETDAPALPAKEGLHEIANQPPKEEQLPSPEATGKEERQELTDQLQRLQAEFENFRKRLEKEQESIRNEACVQTIEDLLPIIDHLDRALATPHEKNSFTHGIELIRQEFAKLLEERGVRPMEAKGQRFDPNLHEALLTEENKEATPNTIIEVIEQGYLLGGRVLRHAKVKVTR